MKDKLSAVSSPKERKTKKHFDPAIMRAWCKNCGICSAFCPKHVIDRNDMGAPMIDRPDDCTGCRFCELHCPDFAIAVKEREKEHGRVLS